MKSIRPEILRIPPYIEGKSPAPGNLKQYKLSSNENPIGSSPLAIEAMKDKLNGGVSLYPDPRMPELREAVSAFWQKRNVPVKHSEIIFGDSADEIINMIAAGFISPGDEVIISENGFSMYEICSLSRGAALARIPRKDFKVDLDAIAGRALKSGRPKLVMFSNPDNPTSTFHDIPAIKGFLDRIPPGTAVLLDEAYIHFAGIGNSFMSLREEYPNLIICFTFSKAYGLAGLRVGYAVLHEKIAAEIEKIRLPFNLGTLQQSGAAASLRDEEFLKMTLTAVDEGRAYLENKFAELGIRYIKPYGNFIFTDLGPKSREIKEHLEKNGITIRPLVSFGFPGNYFRISVGSMEANRFLIEKIGDICKNKRRD